MAGSESLFRATVGLDAMRNQASVNSITTRNSNSSHKIRVYPPMVVKITLMIGNPPNTNRIGKSVLNEIAAFVRPRQKTARRIGGGMRNTKSGNHSELPLNGKNGVRFSKNLDRRFTKRIRARSAVAIRRLPGMSTPWSPGADKTLISNFVACDGSDEEFVPACRMLAARRISCSAVPGFSCHRRVSCRYAAERIS
jgi:hypothetical protein